MHGVVKKWGNSAAVRIPASVLEAAAVGLDQPVDIREDQGCIIIEPLRPERYNLAALVAGITDENRHALVDPGPAIGQEIW